MFIIFLDNMTLEEVEKLFERAAVALEKSNEKLVKEMLKERYRKPLNKDENDEM